MASTKAPLNIIARIGLWVTVGTALVWVGGQLIQKIEFALPYCLGVGIVLMAVGIFVQSRKVDVPEVAPSNSDEPN